MFSTKYKSSLLMAIYFLFSVSCAYFSAHGRAYKKAQSANKRGNYEQAVYASVDALRIKPDYEDVEKIMDEAFPKAIRKHHKKIDRLKSHQKDFYWDKILIELKIYPLMRLIFLGVNIQNVMMSGLEMKEKRLVTKHLHKSMDVTSFSQVIM